MKLQTGTKMLTALMTMLIGIAGWAEELDFGDHSSSTITTKAWEALSADKADNAIAFADKCIELYAKQALKMQSELDDYADESDASSHWALNDVGTCYFIKAKALQKQKNAKEAIAAYSYLSKKLEYAQCWDTNGWFWKPAEAADEALQELKTAAK